MSQDHEKQFAVSAQSQNEHKKNHSEGSWKQNKTGDKKNLPIVTSNNRKSPDKEPEIRERRCFRCKQLGHLWKDCPVKTEAPGRSAQTGAAVYQYQSVGAGELPVQAADLTESQLENLLAERRLNREQRELAEEGDRSQTSAVHASEEKAGAVGALLHVDLNIEGLPVKAMVDTGAQSTIVSRSTLHAVNRYLKQWGRELPPLELPTVCLYGKDGEKGGKQLVITVHVPLVLSFGDISV